MRTMEAEVKENSENVAPSTECSLLKQTDEIKDEKSGETEAINTNQQQQMTGKAEQTSGDGDGETRQVRIRKQVQRFSETMSKRYADEQAAKEKAHDAVAAQLGKGSGTPLSEIPLIEASIRGCKPMDLKTLHYACFGRVGGVAEVRSNLRKFSGFSFGRESEEYGKRVQALNRKPVKEVQNALRQLHLEVSGTRVQLVTRLLDFLLKPVADAVKCKGKLPPSKRKPGAGCKSLSKKEEDDKKCPSNKPKKSAEESETEGDEIGCSSDGAEQGEEEEAEPVVGPEAEEEDEYEVEEDDEEESGMSDADYAPGKKVAKKRRSTAVVKTSKSPRKAKRRRKQVIESDEYDRIGANDGDRSSTKEEAEVADVEAKDEEMKELMQSKGAGRAREGAAEDRGNASSSKPASHSAVFPSDEELKSKVLEILRNANLNEVSMKVVRTSVSEHYKDVDLSPKKQFINGVIEEYLGSSS